MSRFGVHECSAISLVNDQSIEVSFSSLVLHDFELGSVTRRENAPHLKLRSEQELLTYVLCLYQ